MPKSATSGLNYEITDQPSADEVRIVEQALTEFNVKRARPYDKRPLHVFLRDPNGATIGGATGFTNWEWLYIDCFWLPEHLRGSGWGASLLAAAEEEARRRGC